MRKFFIKIYIFIIPIVLFFLSGLLLPTTPRASKSLLFANKLKDSLLKNTKKPRMLFIGGSNLSFGLNSNIIKDSLDINPINTGIHIDIGLKYMLDNVLHYIKKNDIIIIVPEYSHFYRSYDRGSNELFRTIFDVNPKKIELLSFKQMINLLKYIPKYTISKYKYSEYYDFKESDVYSVNSFNKYGDVDAHWNLPNRLYKRLYINGSYNSKVITKIKSFVINANKKGAKIYISFPGIDKITYNNYKSKIKRVERAYHYYGLNVLGTPERYVFQKKMIFNGCYHLNKEGVDLRTKLLIEDIKKAIKKK